jgi:hypothetical protein
MAGLMRSSSVRGRAASAALLCVAAVVIACCDRGSVSSPREFRPTIGQPQLALMGSCDVSYTATITGSARSRLRSGSYSVRSFRAEPGNKRS